jgi:hypothetical protein
MHDREDGYKHNRACAGTRENPLLLRRIPDFPQLAAGWSWFGKNFVVEVQPIDIC